MDFGRRITAIYGLNLALSYENAAAERLEQRASQCIVPEVKKNLERHLKQTREQQERLRERIQALAAATASSMEPGATTPTTESGRLPIPEPPRSFKNMMEEVGTAREREIWESVNDLIVEKAEVVMYRSGIQALELLGADKKTISALKKNLQEEEAFAKLLEKNNPRIAKKLMKDQMKEGKKKRIAQVEATTAAATGRGEGEEEEEEKATAAAAADSGTVAATTTSTAS
jgi:ferritin-like metal-binding protein YciE